MGLCSHLAHSWATANFVPIVKRWRPPKWQGLCSHPADLWAIFDIVPQLLNIRNPAGAKSYVSTGPTSEPPLILSLDSRNGGPAKRQGLCSHPAHLWTSSAFVPCCEALGGGNFVDTQPTCGSLLISSLNMKHCGPPKCPGFFLHPVHLWGTY